MATASPANPQDTALAQLSAKPAARAAAPSVQVSAPSRREFLYYIWGASIALLLGESTFGLLWFIFPRFKEGEFGGIFTVDPAELPAANTRPTSIAAGRFHISQTSEGLRILYGVCTHLGCLPKWVDTNNRFECPCHGSKFQLSGDWIEGPAPRHLDRFPVAITYEDGEVVETPADGSAIVLDTNRVIVDVRVNTGKRILGQSHG